MGHGGLSLFLQHNVRRQGSSRSAANRGCELLVREKRESLSRDSGDAHLAACVGHSHPTAGREGGREREREHMTYVWNESLAHIPDSEPCVLSSA
jgi:hypothetical protein